MASRRRKKTVGLAFSLGIHHDHRFGCLGCERGLAAGLVFRVWANVIVAPLIALAALACAALGALLSTSAFADIVTETYTGTVIGTDYEGYFGTPGSDLSNATFTATYVFDTNHTGSTPDHNNFITSRDQ
jgi:hypothetical protein